MLSVWTVSVLGCLLVALAGAGRVEAGIANTPLPQFADGKPSVMVVAVPGVVKRNRLQTEIECTSLASSAVDIGVELFDPSGALLNDVHAGVGALLNVSPGQTVTFGTGGTAAFLESVVIPVAGVAQGSARVVASAAAVRCSVLVVDNAVTPPVTVVELGLGVQPQPGAVPSTVALPQFASGRAATHAAVIPGVVKRGQMETEIFCTSLASQPFDLGVQIFGADGVLGNDVGAGNGAVLNVAPGATVTFGTTGTASFLETVVIALAGVAQGLARVVSTSGQVTCEAFAIDAALSPPTSMSRLIGASLSSGAAPTATATVLAAATPTPNLSPLCPAGPRGGCRTPAKSILSIKQATPDSADKLIWKWLKGAATSLADFGTPTVTADYSLCVYDATGLRMELRAPAAGVCAGKDCWAQSATGFKYKDTDETPDGIFRLLLKSGPAGKARLLVKGSGDNLPDPTLPLAVPVRAQVVNRDTAVCWDATYSSGEVLRNEPGQFKALSRN